MAPGDGKGEDASKPKPKSIALEDGSEFSDEDGKAVEVRAVACARKDTKENNH